MRLFFVMTLIVLCGSGCGENKPEETKPVITSCEQLGKTVDKEKYADLMEKCRHRKSTFQPSEKKVW